MHKSLAKCFRSKQMFMSPYQIDESGKKLLPLRPFCNNPWKGLPCDPSFEMFSFMP